MILNNAPANEAIISNVSEIGEFRIRNSAKAFSILSSGLYANKIRAIIRELSCNAVDSHVAAGKSGVPFDVHLPNQLEPWFSIRDYGTGLSHKQVTNIYTTYFESTKTNSNEFIGALGLGSKSPFSYTDNFTVTAVQNGKKGIYSAFINGEGVPSIALMMSEDTEDANGVEIKFSVNSYSDFDKFRQEARQVYTYFNLRPVVSGNGDFGFTNVEYESQDIIPGVHAYKGRQGSNAIMGNIAYGISIPQSETVLGDLKNLLNCGLEIHFGIGELDFQASREGLSYIPQTIEAIKNKLTAVNAVLTTKLSAEADAIPNLWDRAVFLLKKKEAPLWSAAVNEYATTTKLPTLDDLSNKSYIRSRKFELKVSDLASQYNITIRGVQRSRHSKTVSNLKTYTAYGTKDANSNYVTWQEWHLNVDADSHFIVNDLKKGAVERAKHHYRETNCDVHARNIYILEKADKTKNMDTSGFFAAICNPPEARRFLATGLLEKERTKGMGKDVTIMKMERRGGSGYRRSDDEMVWRDAGKSDSFDSSQVYYYIPLSGFTMLSTKGYTSSHELYQDIRSLPGLFSGNIYGVRKGDIEEIQKKPNWKNIEEYVTTSLSGKDNAKILMSLVKSKLDAGSIFDYNNKEILEFVNDKSPYAVLVNELVGIEKFKGSEYNVDRLFRRFAPNTNLDPAALVNKYQTQVNSVKSRYPLLVQLSSYRTTAGDIAEYINLIDAKKGI